MERNSALIERIEIYKLFIPLRKPFVISLGPIKNVENVIVIIRTQDGCAGYGECSPYMTINGESVDTCFIVGQYFAKALKGADALDISGCMDKMDSIIYCNTSIKSAFDIALHDIASQHAGLPLYKFLSNTENRTLYTDMTISIGEPAKMKEDAIRFKKDGFPAIKVKLGEDLDTDVARIKAIREGIGPELPLRIDANQGWKTPENAIAVLQALGPYNIEHCEEPIARWRYMDLSKVSAASPIPIMADESCGDEHDAERLINLKACDMFNIKLGKSAGLLKAMRIAKVGKEANMEMQVGGFMESRLGMTAAAHLVMANPHIHHCDFDTPLMFTEDPVVGGIQYGAGGTITLPDTPGLGAVINQKYLKSTINIVV